MVSLTVFAVGILVEPKLKLQTDPVQWVNQDSQVVRNIHALEKGTGSANEMGVYVTTKGDVFAQPNIAFVDSFTTRQLKVNHATLATANSVISNVSDLLNDIPGTAHVTPTSAEVEAAYNIAPRPSASRSRPRTARR